VRIGTRGALKLAREEEYKDADGVRWGKKGGNFTDPAITPYQDQRRASCLYNPNGGLPGKGDRTGVSFAERKWAYPPRRGNWTTVT